MIRPSTIVYLVLLLGLVGAYFFLKNREKPGDIEVTAQPSSEVTYLFPADAGTPSSIRIESKSGESVEIARGADNAWVVNQPSEAKAEQGAAEAAATQITTIPVLDTVPDVDPKIVGLDDPQYVLTVKFTSGGERTVEVGVITPTESGYYVSGEKGQVLIVSRDAIDSLLGLLTNPPYLETLTPAPATPEGDVSATETVTPQP